MNKIFKVFSGLIIILSNLNYKLFSSNRSINENSMVYEEKFDIYNIGDLNLENHYTIGNFGLGHLGQNSDEFTISIDFTMHQIDYIYNLRYSVKDKNGDYKCYIYESLNERDYIIDEEYTFSYKLKSSDLFGPFIDFRIDIEVCSIKDYVVQTKQEIKFALTNGTYVLKPTSKYIEIPYYFEYDHQILQGRTYYDAIILNNTNLYSSEGSYYRINGDSINFKTLGVQIDSDIDLIIDNYNGGLDDIILKRNEEYYFEFIATYVEETDSYFLEFKNINNGGDYNIYLNPNTLESRKKMSADFCYEVNNIYIPRSYYPLYDELIISILIKEYGSQAMDVIYNMKYIFEYETNSYRVNFILGDF